MLSAQGGSADKMSEERIRSMGRIMASSLAGSTGPLGQLVMQLTAFGPKAALAAGAMGGLVIAAMSLAENTKNLAQAITDIDTARGANGLDKKGWLRNAADNWVDSGEQSGWQGWLQKASPSYWAGKALGYGTKNGDANDVMIRTKAEQEEFNKRQREAQAGAAKEWGSAALQEKSAADLVVDRRLKAGQSLTDRGVIEAEVKAEQKRLELAQQRKAVEKEIAERLAVAGYGQDGKALAAAQAAQAALQRGDLDKLGGGNLQSGLRQFDARIAAEQAAAKSAAETKFAREEDARIRRGTKVQPGYEGEFNTWKDKEIALRYQEKTMAERNNNYAPAMAADRARIAEERLTANRDLARSLAERQVREQNQTYDIPRAGSAAKGSREAFSSLFQPIRTTIDGQLAKTNEQLKLAIENLTRRLEATMNSGGIPVLGGAY